MRFLPSHSKSEYHPYSNWRLIMLSWAITFLIIALIAGVLGFGGVMTTSAGIAKILFGVFLVLFLISALANALKGRSVA